MAECFLCGEAVDPADYAPDAPTPFFLCRHCVDQPAVLGKIAVALGLTDVLDEIYVAGDTVVGVRGRDLDW
jgi:hypothetical protein